MKFGRAELDELVLRLQQAEISATPDQILAAHDLLLRLQIEDRMPEPSGCRPLFAPVFCRSPQEQERFYRLYDNWWQKPRTDAGEIKEPGAVVAEPPAVESNRAGLWRLFVTTAVILAIALYVILRAQPVTPPAPRVLPPEVADTSVPPKAHKEPERKPSEQAPDVILPRPPERIAARLHLPAGIAVTAPQLRWAAVPIPLLLFLAFLLWRFSTRRLLLSRGKPDEPPDPHRLPVRGAQDDLFTPHRLRSTIDRLRTPTRVPLRQIDNRRTVDATLRKAGLFTPVYRTRRQLPEYVVFIDRAHPADHLAAFGRALIERLRSEGLTAYIYYFYGDPRRCRQDDRSFTSISLDDIESHHGGARLLLLTDAREFFSPFTGQIEPWTNQLSRWASRSILTPAPARRWGHREFTLALHGFAVAPLDSGGLDAVARWLVTGTALTRGAESAGPLLRRIESAPALPYLIERYFAQWTREEAPRDVDLEEMLASLRRYLGEQGYFVLCALAVYPQCTWSLTLYLDWRLAPPNEAGAERERRLFDLARLPWLRRAYLPDYLRLRLIKSLPQSREQEVRKLYKDLFDSAQKAGKQAIELTIDAAPSPDVWRQLQRLFAWSRPRSPYADRIYAKMMLIGRPGILDLEVSRFLERILPARWQRVALTSVTGLLIASVLGAGAYALTGPLESRVDRKLLALERERNGGSVVIIRYGAEHQVQAAALGASLEDWGFDAVFQQAALLPQAPLQVENRIVYRTPADAGVAQWIADRVAYASYGLRPTVGEFTLLDEAMLPGSPSTQKLPLYVAIAVTLFDGLEDRGVVESPFISGVAEIFQDRLAKGGLGPQMVVLPAGPLRLSAGELSPAGTDITYVDVPQPFAIGRYEVTLGDFRRFVSATGYRTDAERGGTGLTGCDRSDQSQPAPRTYFWQSPGFEQRDDHPVVCVSWNDAQAYVNWLGVQTSGKYRLPTETEWEYAARGGEARTQPWNAAAQACRYANLADVGDCRDEFAATAPVGHYAGNRFEVYDTLGNVTEWTDGCPRDSYAYEANLNPNPNPQDQAIPVEEAKQAQESNPAQQSIQEESNAAQQPIQQESNPAPRSDELQKKIEAEQRIGEAQKAEAARRAREKRQADQARQSNQTPQASPQQPGQAEQPIVSCTARIVRGPDWGASVQSASVRQRTALDSNASSRRLGFRVVREVPVRVPDTSQSATRAGA